MPLQYCHPSAPHKRLRLPEWYVSSLMLERALDAVRHMPQTFKHRDRDIETDRFLILHEEVEKTMIDQLNLHYLHAHQIAARAEQAAVRACGINWRAYDDFMQANVKHIGDERLSKVPGDLDLKPYRDEHDTELLERMAQAIERGHHPSTHHPTKLHKAIHATIAHIRTGKETPKHATRPKRKAAQR